MSCIFHSILHQTFTSKFQVYNRNFKRGCQSCQSWTRDEALANTLTLESDLHTKRTGHTEVLDKNYESVKPIILESPSSTAPIDIDSQEMFVPEVDKALHQELEGMGFSIARTTII
ncbi:uncharacterized protein LOC110733839 [Chenopodium quinoa]|uniref:uncharacterized protein LOC110733839 n=1 Tax=Chenopodium quinoa TaxID=63459 RepID=UPI000B793BC5|nr:uncharacterized protein LOC110733839 [Chenopodium quinoa]